MVEVTEKAEAGAKAAYEYWSNWPACTASDPWDVRCEKMPGSAEFFRKLSSIVLKAALASPAEVVETPPPESHVRGGEAIKARAIEIICKEAEDMGFPDDTLAEFRAGEFDGDDLLTLQAVERALDTHSTQPNVEARVPDLEKQIKDLKHDLASAEGRAKNAASNSEYWRGQYEALGGTPAPQPNPETSSPPGNQIRTAECDGKDAVPETGQLPVGTASTPPPQTNMAAPTYRFLQDGDVIEATDEFIGNDGQTWAHPDGWEVGMEYPSKVFKAARRLVSPAPQENVVWTSPGQLQEVERGGNGTITSHSDEFMCVPLCVGRPTTAVEAFARWVEEGPKLAKAAGVYVGIKVTNPPPQPREDASHPPQQEPARLREADVERIAKWLEGQRNDVPAHGWEFATALRAALAEDGL